MSEKPFYVVWNPDHGLPRVRHGSYAMALSEAKRLAQSHRGSQFHVLGSVCTTRAPEPVEVIAYEPMFRRDSDDEIPF